MDGNAMVIDVALTKNGNIDLALKILMFIMPSSTEEEVTKIINSTWDAAPRCLGSWALAVPEMNICCWGTQDCAHLTRFSAVGPTAKAGVNICAGVLQATSWGYKY